jgi:hypothetical protein
LVPEPARVAPTANVRAPVASRTMGWAVWLLIPVAVTILAALGSWWRGRPPRTPNTEQAMQAHGEFLDALSQTARSKERGLSSGD